MAGRFREVESVRGLAAAAVLLYHLGFVAESVGRWPALARATGYGWLGVSVFFVVSGFLLYRPFAAATLKGAEWPSLSRYARSRVLRIVPAYWTMLLVLLVLGRGLLSAGPLMLATIALPALYLRASVRARLRDRRYALATLIASHILVAFLAVRAVAADPGDAVEIARNFLFFYASADGWFVLPAWTLAIEISFYAALPFAARAIAARAGGRPLRVVAMLLPLVALGVSYRAAAATILPGLPLILPGYVDQFALGMLIAVGATWGVRLSRVLVAAISVSALACAVLASRLGEVEQSATGSVLLSPCVAAAFAVALLHLVQSGAAPLRARATVGLGRLSYGIYLWHLPIISVVLLAVPREAGNAPFLLFAVAAVALTLSFAAASWRYVEAPALRLRGRGDAVRKSGEHAPLLAGTREPHAIAGAIAGSLHR